MHSREAIAAPTRPSPSRTSRPGNARCPGPEANRQRETPFAGSCRYSATVVKGTRRSSFEAIAAIVSDTPRLVPIASAISYRAPSSWLASPMPSSSAAGVRRAAPPEASTVPASPLSTAPARALTSRASSSPSCSDGSRWT